MLSLSVFMLAAVAQAVLAQEQCSGLTGPEQDACDMQAAFGGSTVVPDVIPVFNPQGALYLTYGTVTVGGAQQLSPSRTLTAPTVAFSPSNASVSTSGPFVLLMVDADSSKPDTVQWLAQDLTLGSGGLLSSTSTPLAPYLSPKPDSGAASERIVALLYAQPAHFALPSNIGTFPNTATGSRVGFDVTSFVKDTGLADPIAGSFFKSTNDGSVTGTPTAADAAPNTTSASTSGTSVSSSSSSGTTTSASQSVHSSHSSSTSTSASTSESAAATSSSTSGSTSLLVTKSTTMIMAMAMMFASWAM